jgi:hypothetical protein
VRKKLRSLKILLFTLISLSSLAKVTHMQQISFGMGMVSSGFSQNEATLDDNESASSGSVSVISFDFAHEFFQERKESYFYRLTASGLAGEVSKYYGASGGKRYYFGADGTYSVFENESLKIKVTPNFRYYVGWSLGVFSMVYETDVEVRSDVGAEYGGVAGILYSRDAETSYKAEITALQGTGVETSSMNIQIFFGFSYYISSLF